MAHVTIGEARNPHGVSCYMGKAAGGNVDGDRVGAGNARCNGDGGGGGDCEHSAILDEMLQDVVAADRSSGEPTLQKSPARGFQKGGRGGGRSMVSAVEKEAIQLAAACVVEQQGIKASAEGSTAAAHVGLDHSAPARGANTSLEGAAELHLETPAFPSSADAKSTIEQN